jgi:RHS repeat-associated protein
MVAVPRAVFGWLLLFFLVAADRVYATDGFFTLAPCRLFDSRLAGDAPELSANVSRLIQIAGKCGVPADATAVSATVTSVSPTGAGNFVVYPSTQSSNFTSAVNFAAGQNRANHGIWKLGAGALRIYPAGVNYTVHAVIDVDGYFSPSLTNTENGPLDYHPVHECRVRDTRLGDAPLASGELRRVDVKGVCGVPELAPAAAFRLTAIAPNAIGHMRVYSSAQTPTPIFSTLNVGQETIGGVVTSGAFARLGDSPGDVTLLYTGFTNPAPSTHVALDVTGYFRRTGPAPGLRYVPMDGCRVLDTRGGTPLGSAYVTYDMAAAQCGVPREAKAVTANFTVLTPNGQGYLIAHGAGESEPVISTTTFIANEPAVANAAIVPITNGFLEVIPRIFSGAAAPSANLLIDVFGYWVEGCDPAQSLCQETTSSAQVHPNTARGGVANTPFSSGDVDRVNLFNGNLNINIPLGGPYPVGPALSYGFNLAYNANMWRSNEGDSTPEPDQQFNAGLGWQVTHGHLYAPFSRPPGDPRWVYVAPDGSEHVFFERLKHEDAEDPGDDPLNPQAQTYYYTRDGSFIRLTQKKPATTPSFPASNAYQSRVELPNGEIQFFDGQGRPVEFRDRFGTLTVPENWVRFDYSVNGRTRITDSWGRTHTIWTESRSGFPQTVTQVDMAAVGGATSTVKFTYSDQSIWRPCQQLGDLRVTVPLLQRVDFSPDNNPATPDEWFYAMEDYALLDLDNAGQSCRSAGALEQLRLPSGGKLRWTYKNVSFPAGSTRRPFSQRSNGVISRATLTPGNATIGTWTYSHDAVTPFDLKQKLTTMTDPLGVVSKSYFSVYSSTATDPEGWTIREYGLPLTHRASLLDPTEAPNLLLSAQVFEAGAATPIRTTWVRYERDAGISGEFDVSTSVNARLASDRTIYEDDCATSGGTNCTHRYKSTDRTSWDNLGHFRITTLGGNFPSGNFQTVETTYNPSGVRPSITTPWSLETYNSVRIDAGAGNLSYTRTSFDGATGSLLSKGVNFLGTSTAHARDVVTAFTRATGQRGFVTTETVSGGDTGTAFVKNYTWTCGTLASSRVQGATYFDSERTIDCSTGLPLSERDRAGQTTTYGYDLAGRRTLTRSPGEADLVMAYLPLSNGSKVTTVRRSSGVDLQKTEAELDELGRFRMETRFRTEYNAGGSLVTKRDVQKQTYDAAGHVATRSTVVDSGQSASPPTTKYQQYDAFGRAHRILRPDGSDTVLFFAGDFSQTSITGVGRSFSTSGVLQQTGAEKTERFDRMGRLWKVTEQAEDAPDGTNAIRCATATGFSTDPSDCYTDTLYTYDEGSRLTKVTQQTDKGTQIREMRYDPRGFMESEIHPELDAVAGQGVDVLYGDYNALGLAGFRREAISRLDYVYDSAAQLIRVDETTGGITRFLKKYRFGTGNADGSNGRVVEATRYNYRKVGGVDFVVGLTESIQYLGTGGRVSNTTLKAAVAPGTTETAIEGLVGVESFTTGFAYDNLGNLTRIDYPQCNFSQGQCSTATAAARSVAFQYRDGLLVGIPGFTGETVPGAGTGSGITYHPNGLWNKVAHANGAVYTQFNDPDGIPRPQRYELARPGSVNTIGPYVYDNSGNVVKVGNEKHLYDLTSRGWKSQMDDGVYGQEMRYDGFGNIQQFVSGVSFNARATPTSPATNRLTTAGYDGVGRMTSWNGRQYLYDAAGELATETIPGTANWAAETWHYMYTVDGQRVWAFSGAENGRPRRDRWTLRGLRGESLREYYAENFTGWTNIKDFVWRDGRHLLASVAPGEGTRHFFADHIKSTRLIADAAGNNVPFIFSFLPFGEQFGTPGPSTEPTSLNERHRFAGHERDLHDPASFADDLDYMHARHYNPLLGRFTSVDRGAAIQSVPQSWNRYAYALNRPTTLRDPDGRSGGIDYDEMAQKIGPLAGLVWLYVDSPMAKAEHVVLISGAAAAALTGGLIADTVLTVTGVRFTGDVERDLQVQASATTVEWGRFSSTPHLLPLTAIALSWIPSVLEHSTGLDIRSEHYLSEDIAKALEPEQWDVSFVTAVHVEDEITVTTTWENLPFLQIPPRTFTNLKPLPMN